jgi:hypothetical protein
MKAQKSFLYELSVNLAALAALILFCTLLAATALAGFIYLGAWGIPMTIIEVALAITILERFDQ